MGSPASEMVLATIKPFIRSGVEPPKGSIYNYPIRPWHDTE
jgi:hypothetical protein